MPRPSATHGPSASILLLTLALFSGCAESPVEPSASTGPTPTLDPAVSGEYTQVNLGTPMFSAGPIGLNNRGEAAFYGSPDYYSTPHGFHWRNGTTTDLGSLGYQYVVVMGLNQVGTVVGQSAGHGFVWQGGTMTDVGGLPNGDGDYAYASGVNSSGAVVGSSGGRAFLWRDGAMTDLIPSAGVGSQASAINDAGQVIGLYTPSGQFWSNIPFFWHNGVVTEIPVPVGAYGVQLQGLNARGQVIGNVFGWPQATSFLWHRGVVTDLGSLGGYSVFAHAINDAGDVVGGADLGSPFIRHGFLWRKGVLMDLGTLGGNSSTATAINAAGVIVGSSQTATGEYRAFVWRDGEMTAVGPPGSAARDINERGDILGTVPGPNWSTQVVIWRRR